ncbi:hypothetical protein KSS87_022839 [Heliosperma pusillum]|nr:hypothetical protein KSS87_022839 [Heliosperma pusillum]
MGVYLSTPKTEKFSEDGENSRVRYGLSSMQGWRSTMEDAHAAFPDLDASTSFFGVYDGHGGKVVSKFCAKFLHQQVLKSEAYSAEELATALEKAFFRYEISFPHTPTPTSLDHHHNHPYLRLSLLLPPLLRPPPPKPTYFRRLPSACRRLTVALFLPSLNPLSFHQSTSPPVHQSTMVPPQPTYCRVDHHGPTADDHDPTTPLTMDEMMRGQKGWRELAILGDKINKFIGMIEGLIWSPRNAEGSEHDDNWSFEDVGICDLDMGPHSDFAGPTCGSTACVSLIRGDQLLVANAGDSRCVISRKGQAYNLSRDHKPELEAERDRILKAGGFIHAGRVNGSLNLTRAIGDMEFKQNKFLPVENQIVTANPDINAIELCEDDDFLVLACDGIWDCMSSQQLVDFVREQLKTETKLSAVCERVFDRCLAPSTAAGEGCDNMTMIIVQFKKPDQNVTLSTDNEPLTPQPVSEAEPKHEPEPTESS